MKFCNLDIFNRLLVKRALLVNDVHHGERPDEKHAWFIGGVWNNDERGDVVVHLALRRHATADQLGRNGGADDVAVVAHVPDAELQAELLVPLADDSVLAEHHRLGPEMKNA